MDNLNSSLICPVGEWDIAPDRPFEMIRFRFHYLGLRMPDHPSMTEIFAITVPQAEKLISDLQKQIVELKADPKI